MKCNIYTTDIDECIINPLSCINSDCINTNGSYTCGECYPGFNRTGIRTAPCCKLVHLNSIKRLNKMLFFVVCRNGDIRLMDGNSSSSGAGRVEVCIGNVYGTVCNDRWDEADATVVCRQLGKGWKITDY